MWAIHQEAGCWGVSCRPLLSVHCRLEMSVLLLVLALLLPLLYVLSLLLGFMMVVAQLQLLHPCPAASQQGWQVRKAATARQLQDAACTSATGMIHCHIRRAYMAGHLLNTQGPAVTHLWAQIDANRSTTTCRPTDNHLLCLFARMLPTEGSPGHPQ